MQSSSLFQNKQSNAFPFLKGTDAKPLFFQDKQSKALVFSREAMQSVYVFKGIRFKTSHVQFFLFDKGRLFWFDKRKVFLR
jgi:hypothetical protein